MQCAYDKRTSMHLILICAWSGIISTVGISEDSVEKSSVIPIAKKSAENVGTEISVKTLSDGTSSRWVRRNAVNQFPVELMAAESQASAREIMDNLSLFRRLPTIELESDRRCYEFFTNHPDVAVSLWRAMKISQVAMTKKTADTFETDTQDGTRGTVKVLLNTPEHYVVTCEGEFKSPAIKAPVKARAMMHLKPVYTHEGIVTHELDMYVSFPSTAIEAIARLISPVSNRIADRNFEEISLFVEMMSLAMSRQPGWVEQIAMQLEGIQKEDTDKLLKLTAEVYVDAVQKERARLGQSTSVSNILPPTKTVSAQEQAAR